MQPVAASHASWAQLAKLGTVSSACRLASLPDLLGSAYLQHLSPDYFLGTEYFLELGANAA